MTARNVVRPPVFAALCAAAALAVALPLVSATAIAKDSHAPPGARDRWLPCEQWVMFHWLPFDDRRLYALTGIEREEFHRYIRDDDHHSLGRLIRRHGKDPDAIVTQMMRQWQGKVSEAQLTELTRRANELMTQGHLAQHVFFHYYHHPGMALNAKWIFNVRPADYQRARMRGFNPVEIGAYGGRTKGQVVRRARVVLARYSRRGVTTRQFSHTQAKRFNRLQRKATWGWLHQDIHQYRQGKFPRGYPAVKGSRLKQACTYMAGSSHPSGEHDPMD